MLAVVFRVADDEGLLLLDLKDLRVMLDHVASRAAEIGTAYGRVSAASIGAIQRGLLALEQQGGERLFGEPALRIDDLMRVTGDGRGVVSVLAAQRLFQAPKLYASLLLWLLSELFEELPEVGDLERPRLVFFFDEAHLLFDDAPAALRDEIEQVVRLVRSKGVGVYLVTQSPGDVPDDVLGQLGNRVQHALRAFTPRDGKAVRAAAQTFRTNPALDVERAIGELGVGEALVSFLDERGMPTPADRALVCPPRSRIGSITSDERARVVATSPLAGAYDRVLDRESAYEVLRARAERATGRARDADGPAARRPGRQREGAGEVLLKSAARSLGSAVGRELGGRVGARILRGVLGSLLGGGR